MGNDFYVHDSVVLTEAATKFLSQGENFYKKTYYETPYAIYKDIFYGFKGSFHENPAMVHYIYLPFIPIFSLPFYHFFNQTLGFFDERFVHLFLFLILLPFLWQLPKERENKILLLLLFCFNPFFLIFFVAGYNDIFVFFWLILSLYFLSKKNFFPSAVTMALACASKQSAWLILPFYFYHLYLTQENIQSVGRQIFVIFKKLTPFFIASLIIFIPFIIWGYNDFVDDIYRYPAGTIATSYPMIGYGLSYLLFLSGFVKSIWDYFPFWIIQLIVGFPLFAYLISKQKKNNTLSQLLFNYGIFLLVFWFFSRFFQKNYISYLVLIFFVAWQFEEKYNILDKKIDNNNFYERDIIRNN